MSKTVKRDEQPETGCVYDLAQLRRHCLTLFGVTPSAFDGATAGLTGPFTLPKMKERLEAWKTRGV